MACQAPEPRMQHPDWRQQRSRTCCLTAKKTVLAAEGERPRDPQSVARPPQGSRVPWDNHHPPPPFDGRGFRGSEGSSGCRLMPCP